MPKRAEKFDAAAAAKMTSEELETFLLPREAKFVREFLRDLNGTQAAIRAGYAAGKENAAAAVRASRLLRDPRVRAYRTALVRESADNAEISRESVTLKLLEIYQRCMSAIPVMAWSDEAREWVESGEWRFDARGAAKALEQLCRLHGLDAPQQHEVHADGIEELLATLNGGREF